MLIPWRVYTVCPCFFSIPPLRTRGRHLATLVPGDVAGVGAKLLDEVPMFNRLEMYEDVLI